MKIFLLFLSLAVLLMLPIPSLAQEAATVPPIEEAATVPPIEEAATVPPIEEAATVPPAPEATPPSELEVSARLFPWYDPDTKEVDWALGLIRFLLGAIGALVMVYLSLGEFLPSMGGKADYLKDVWELGKYKEMRHNILLSRKEQAGQIQKQENLREEQVETERLRLDVTDEFSDDLNKIIEFLATRVDRNRWRLFFLGFPIYILLGGFFATALALNMMQALLIGFSWTAIVERFGLARQQAEVEKIKAKEVAELQQRAVEVDKLKEENKSLKGQMKDLEWNYNYLRATIEKTKPDLLKKEGGGT